MCGSKRIVVYDTLIRDIMDSPGVDKQGIFAIIGHEIGHSIMHHTWALLAVTQVNFLSMFGTFGFVQNAPGLVTDFGFALPANPTAAAFLLIQCYLTVYGLVMPIFSIFMNAFTRRLEFSADAYSARLGFDLGPPLIAISKKNLSDCNPDWLVSMCHDNHPTLIERLRALGRLQGGKRD